ncbi:TolC family protein [Novosphingobium sp. FKTRR1]|uniref:TolC family protein n=1 Tax=Novosphingobium sp. FKTRR1 TaxID=2879118 RepID=UPI001CF063BB|nr:TolC family protein [Novosphingobium sp. FKTRR1]
MRKAFVTTLAVLGALCPQVGLAAGEPAEAGLPALADVTAALDAHPGMAAALARVRAAQGEADALARGPHELTLSGSYMRRNVRNEGQFSEYEAQVTRPVRLPGKAALDRTIGAQGLAYASNMAEDARHHTALRLAQAWWDWLGCAQEARVDAQAAVNLQALLSSVQRRVQLRDAAQIEADQAAAALATALAQAERSAGREAVAHARLAAQFPGLPLPARAQDLPDPQIPAGGLQFLHDKILGRSHEIAAAEALANQAQAQADRARKERTADPSVGLRVFSEKGGIERGGGLVFSLPLGGGYRSALAERASAQASAAQADLQAVRLDIVETADADLAEAEAAYAAWGRARAARDAQDAALQKARRGHQLGEIDLAAVLLAERQMQDALRTESVARADAQRAITRLRIDAHELWIGDDEAPEAVK